MTDANSMQSEPPTVQTPINANPPQPMPTSQPIDSLKWVRWGLLVAVALMPTILALLGKAPTPTDPVVIPPLPEQSNPAGLFGMGWVNDPEAITASLTRQPAIAFASTPAGRVAMAADDQSADAFHWQAVRKAARKTAPWYPNKNQRDVGCCVGCAWAHAADVCLAVQVLASGREWSSIAIEPIYAISRVEIGGGQIRGDGSVGAWAREAVAKRGVVPMAKYPSADLSQFDPQRARHWGSLGVPSDIDAVAEKHPVKGTARVSTWNEVQKAILQGYPVAVCSDVGFANSDGSPGTRDSQGFCQPRGTWPHAMAIIGIRGGVRPGGFVLNSWGDAAHRGPVWPADAPVAGFWADATVIQRMVQQGDSFALADVDGFPSRKLDWIVRTLPRRPIDLTPVVALAR